MTEFTNISVIHGIGESFDMKNSEKDTDRSKEESQDSLFVGDLGRFCREDELLELFSNYGHVLNVIIKKSKRDGNSLGYGFVKMSTLDEAKLAMEKLDGVILSGRPIKIRWGLRKNDIPADDDKKDDIINSVYIRYKTVDSGVVVTEETLARVCQNYGNVLDASVKSSTFSQTTGLQSGYAFVHFSNSVEGIQSACECVKQLQNVEIDGILFTCEPSKNLLKLVQQIHLTNENDTFIKSTIEVLQTIINEKFSRVSNHKNFKSSHGVKPKVIKNNFQRSNYYYYDPNSFPVAQNGVLYHPPQFVNTVQYAQIPQHNNIAIQHQSGNGTNIMNNNYHVPTVSRQNVSVPVYQGIPQQPAASSSFQPGYSLVRVQSRTNPNKFDEVYLPINSYQTNLYQYL